MICLIINNSVVHYLNMLKFGKLEHYRSVTRRRD